MYSGANVKNVYGYQNDTILHGVCTWKKDTPLLLHIIETLLKKGVDINSKNKIGETPLHVAVSYNNITAAQYLVDNKYTKIQF